MGRLLTATATTTLAACTFLCPARVALSGPEPDAASDDAHSFVFSVDLRAVAADGLPSYLEGGGGKQRFDNSDDGIHVGRIFLDYRGRLTDTLTAHATLNTYADDDKNPIDVTEMYLDWKAFPRGGWRWRAKLGAFYPPISLENRGPGWSSPYSISASAINTWFGEEFRTIGAEVSATWLGSQQNGTGDLTLYGSLYKWNDDVGLLMSFRGWSLNDRQTPLFGHLPFIPIFFTTPPPNAEFRNGFEFFHEIDNRIGYYAGAEWKQSNFLTLRATHYDNRADLSEFKYDYAWLTRYDTVGGRLEARDWTLIGQWLTGDTAVGFIPSGIKQYSLDMDSWFLLASKRIGRHRLTARYDDFSTDQTLGTGFRNWDAGHAWTFAYLVDFSDRWQVAVESLTIDAMLTGRVMLGEPVQATEHLLQLAVRYNWRN